MRPFRPTIVALTALALVLSFSVGCDSAPQPTFTLAPAYSDLFPASDTPTASPPLTVSSPVTNPSPTAPPSATDAPPTQTPHPPTAPATPVSVSIWLGKDVPRSLARTVTDLTVSQAGRYALTDDPSIADVRMGSGLTDSRPVATWVYALVAPFPTLADGVSWEALRSSWAGTPSGPFAGRPLLTTEATLAAQKGILGEPAPGAVVTVTEAELLDRAWAEQPAWAIVPFDELEPRWKVLRLDGVSPLDKVLGLDAYPLVTRVSAAGPSEVLEPFLAVANLPTANRDEGRLTSVVMTGVTALTRATAWRMEQKGMTYPAQDVGDWLRNADITHVSHEVSFDPECGPPNPVQEGLLFCSSPRYIELLEHIGVDVVEMTGNHIADAGVEHVEPTLDMYVERGWQYFGGGRNLDDARQPAIFEHNGNAIAFLGCNPVGPANVWATPERAGAAPCDYEQLYAQIADLRAQGILPIVTLQYWELDRYDPTPQQVADFQALIDAGAVIASGSHAHHAQGFGFHGDGFIHFGVGNLFFDQMQMLGYRQEFIDRHVFYNGRHISTELLTAMLEDWSKPRPMTEQERFDLLQTVFAVSSWE